MNFVRPRPRGTAQRTLALLSSAALLTPLSAFAQVPVPAQAPVPDVAANSTPPELGAGGRSSSPIRPLSGAHNLIARLAPQPMGANNAVRLWVRGDGSGATLRIHLIAAGQDASPADAATTEPSWLSAPIPITWSGWRQIALTQDEFTLRDPDASVALDAALPGDAQPDGVESAPPDWAAINALALETGVPKRAALGVDDIAWASLGTDGTETATAPVDDFETGDFAAWQSVGSADQKKTLAYGLATARSQVHGGRVALNLTVTAPAVARQAALLSVKRLLRRTGKPYLVWTPTNRFEPILPTSLPPAIGADSDLSLQAAPDQILGVGFCVYSVKALSHVTVSVPEGLQGLGRALPRSVMDVRVVKVIKEPGGGLIRDDDFASQTPGLLVKDDLAPLSGPAPIVRMTGDPLTSIPADTAKQFWVTVSVPRNARPGAYSGRLLVSGQGLAAPIVVPLALNVPALHLESPSKQYAINLRSRLDPAPATLPAADGHGFVTDYVSRTILDAQLADIAAHGFHIVTLYDSPETLWDALADYQAAGMYAPFVYKGDGDPSAVEAQRQAHNAPTFVYFLDPLATDAAARAQSLGRHGLSVTTYITRQAAYDALSAGLSLPIYSRDSDYTRGEMQSHGSRRGDKQGESTDWWYWPAADESPTANRLACGWSLVRANLYGAFVPDYQTAFGTDPYDLTSGGAAPDRAVLRSQMLTFPAQDGVVDTLRWEAAREGVVDVRYLTTFYDSLRQCKDAKIAKPLTDQAQAYVKAFLDKSPDALSDADMDQARAQVAHYTLLLRAQLDGYNKKHHIPQ